MILEVWNSLTHYISLLLIFSNYYLINKGLKKIKVFYLRRVYALYYSESVLEGIHIYFFISLFRE
jgi:hypothetical protein